MPVPGYPDFSQPIDLDTDTSLQGLGPKRTEKGKVTLPYMPVGPCGPMSSQCVIIALQN